MIVQPERFGKYFLIDRISAGGMAEVFRAKLFTVGGFEKLFVIKRILPHLSENEEFIAMFTEEAKICTLLSHSNIIQVFDFGKEGRHYFIAMEYVDGKDIRSLMKALTREGTTLPLELSVYIAHEVAKGLDYAHNRKDEKGNDLLITHRDISPANILLSYDGAVKIADFGIAKAARSAYNTKDGVLKGKFEYMSPEQASGLSVDRRTDIFSLGIVLYEMLTGKRLFKTGSDVATLEMIKKGEVPPVKDLNPQIPDLLSDTVMKALAKNVEDRFQDAGSFQSALADFLYPAAPDFLSIPLSRLLREKFAQEIAEEQRILDYGSKIVAEMYKRMEFLLSVPAAPTSPEILPSKAEGPARPSLEEAKTEGVPKRVLRWWIPVLLLAIVGGAGFLVFSGRSFPPGAEVSRPGKQSETPEPSPIPAHAEISFFPPTAKVFLDGTLVKEGSPVAIEVRETDRPHVISIEEDGFETFFQTLVLKSGERFRIHAALTKTKEMEERKTGPLLVKVKSQITFLSEPRGAKVYVNGNLKGETPFLFSTGEPGQTYEVTVSHSGYRDATEKVTFPSGEAKTIMKKLVPLAPGRLDIVSTPWANILLDEKDAGETPASLSLPPGTHRVRLVNPGLNLSREFTVVVRSGETSRVSINLKDGSQSQ